MVSRTQNPQTFYKLAQDNNGLTKTGHLSKQFIKDAAAGKYGDLAKKQANEGIKLSGKTEQVEQENATAREKDKADRERKKANAILARSQRARGGGSYESNPNSTKLG